MNEAKGLVPLLIDVPQWGSISEREIERETGIEKVKLLNDFVANGYGIASLNEEESLA